MVIKNTTTNSAAEGMKLITHDGPRSHSQTTTKNYMPSYASQQGAQTITIDQEERGNHHIVEG